MGRLALLTLPIVFALCTSCTTTKVFSVNNVTDKPVTVTVRFNDSAIAPIVLPVPSRSNDYVSYETTRTSSDLLDHGLSEIHISQERCERLLTRDYVTQFVKDNDWTLRIDDAVMACDE